MKYFLCILFCGTFYAKAQDILPPARQQQNNATSRLTTVQIGDKTMDYRVLRHYSEADLRSMPLSKLNKIYLIYTASYKIINATSCSTFKESDIDVASLESFRLLDQPAVVQYGEDCKVTIELMSRKQLDKTLSEVN